MSLRLDQRPRLARAARLRFDRHSQSYVLLSPERTLRLNASAAEVVQRCTGDFTVGGIIDSLLGATPEDTVSVSELTSDVVGLLHTLQQRQLLVFLADS